ncbi:MAG: terminase family protein [Hyphomonadaceae bacterium]
MRDRSSDGARGQQWRPGRRGDQSKPSSSPSGSSPSGSSPSGQPSGKPPPPREAEALWRASAHAAQLPPHATADGRPWRTWLFQGGRGAGKTRAGAEWLCGLAGRFPRGRFALVGATLNDVREVMIAGPSGLLSLPNRAAPVYEPSRRRLTWPNGAIAYAFSAEEPDRLRGPQFHAAWGDEFCAWARPAETLAMLRMGLRLGGAGRAGGAGAGISGRLAITTTPRPIAALRALRAEAGCAVTQAGTQANAEHLSDGFVDGLMEVYGGTRLAAQEIDGALTEAEGALFSAAMLAGARRLGCELGPSRRMARIVVGVDPPAGSSDGFGGSACGIVAAGVDEGGRIVVLEDASAAGLSPMGWARRAARTAMRWGRTCVHGAVIAAEANQGGEMVRTLIDMALAEEAGGETAGARVKLVRALRGKAERAAPVAALYEQGRVAHGCALPALEDALMALGVAGAGESGASGASDRGASDRADALVWAISELTARVPPRVFGTVNGRMGGVSDHRAAARPSILPRGTAARCWKGTTVADRSDGDIPEDLGRRPGRRQRRRRSIRGRPAEEAARLVGRASGRQRCQPRRKTAFGGGDTDAVLGEAVELSCASGVSGGTGGLRPRRDAERGEVVRIDGAQVPGCRASERRRRLPPGGRRSICRGSCASDAEARRGARRLRRSSGAWKLAIWLRASLPTRSSRTAGSAR